MKQAGIRHVFFALCVGLALPALASVAFAGASADSIAGKVRVVPNPWCASDQAQHYAKRTGNSLFDVKNGYSRVLFVNLPNPCTIRIYTVDGDLVRTIENTAGSSTTWDLITESDQAVTTGIYVWTVDSAVGRDVGKLIIIR